MSSTNLFNPTPYSAKVEIGPLMDFFASLAVAYSEGGPTPLTGSKVDRYAKLKCPSIPVELKAQGTSPTNFLRPINDPTRATIKPVGFMYLRDGGSCLIIGSVTADTFLPDDGPDVQLIEQTWSQDGELIDEKEVDPKNSKDSRKLPAGSLLNITLNWAQNLGTVSSYRAAKPGDPRTLGKSIFCDDAIRELYHLPHNDEDPTAPASSHDPLVPQSDNPDDA